MNALENLTRARAFLADPARWCRGESVIDAKGRAHLASWEGEPAKCCAYGALAHSSNNTTNPPGWEELYEACGGSPIEFNDRSKHADVLAAFDRAIAAAAKTSTV